MKGSAHRSQADGSSPDDARVAAALTSSLERRTRTVLARPDADQLLLRLEHRGASQRRRLVAGAVVVVALGAIAGYLVGSSKTATQPASVVALDDGAPGARPSDTSLPTRDLEPRNVDAAIAAIDQAFHAAFDGGVPDAVRRAATQSGPLLDELRRETLALAQTRGFTSDELAGISIEVLETKFVDRTHGVVRFTLTIPGRGAVLTDQTGYAIFEAGRWRVSLRTACDLLSLSGLGRPCPPGIRAG